jgi:hypothetical protein
MPGLAALALAAGLGAGWAQGDPRSSLEFRLFIHASMAVPDLTRMRDVVDGLMAPAGLATTWLDCDRQPEPCQRRAGTIVQVFLKPHVKPGRPLVCGEVARDPDTDVPSVIVYVGCARAVTSELGRRARDPRLLSLRAGDIVALALAHELGHLWGLAHSAVGVMKARHDANDLMALRSFRLSFATDEAQRLARNVRDGQAQYVRH